MEEISKIIHEIPNILQFFIPGYIFFIIFTAAISKKAEGSIRFVFSCVLSFSFIALINAVCSIFGWAIQDIWVRVAISIGLAVVTSIVFAKLFTSKKCRSLLVTMFQKSPYDSVWRNVLDYETGTNLKVYLKSRPYYIIGHFYSHEENGSDSWFCLNAFVKTDITTNEDLADYSEYNNIFITFHLSEVESIEIFT